MSRPPAAPHVTVPAATPESIFLTGGAGFIGSHCADALLASGRSVTIFDNLSTGSGAWLDAQRGRPGLRVVIADLADHDRLRREMGGHGAVWHLAASADIPGGYTDTRMDLDSSVAGTRNVLEAMRATGVRTLLFSSSGAVYGLPGEHGVTEAAGPLLPNSLYSASKLAAEAFISAYCHLFGLRAWIFRFGNVLGARMPRGVIRDFATRLARDPRHLEILGDGRQAKSYLLVEECIEGMLHLAGTAEADEERPCRVVNLGASGTTDVHGIARRVIAELGLEDVAITVRGDRFAWPGDQPRVRLDVSLAAAHGWQARRTSDEAVGEAVRRMVAHLGLDRACAAGGVAGS